MSLNIIYLLHRPAPGPSPCPLHTQQNSGRNGKKPILWRRRCSSSTRCVDGVTQLRLLLLNAVGVHSWRWFLIRNPRSSRCASRSAPTEPRCDSDGVRVIRGWSSSLFRGGGGCVETGRQGGRETKA